nr:response regulator [Desulfobulbaceae bacterium]
MMERTTRVLIVEDEVLVAEDIKELLGEIGCFVSGMTGSAEDAILRARNNSPDIILMDIMLSGEMDGVEAAEIIRRELDIPIIFLTSYSDKNTLDRAKISEPYAYITKPFDDRDLRNAITITLYRKSLDEQLAKHCKRLESEVNTQTDRLEKINAQLNNKVSELTDLGASLQEKSRQLENANTALRYLLDQRDRDKIEQGDRILLNINDLVIPYLEALKKTHLTAIQEDYVELIMSNIGEILTPFSQHLTSKQIGLTVMELKVADLVKNGKRNKEIAELLTIAPKTVEFHRENIRIKLGILNKKINLRTYLNTAFRQSPESLPPRALS